MGQAMITMLDYETKCSIMKILDASVHVPLLSPTFLLRITYILDLYGHEHSPFKFALLPVSTGGILIAPGSRMRNRMLMRST